MLDLKFIKENRELVQKAVDTKKNKSDVNLDELISKYDQMSEKNKELDLLRSKRNDLNDLIKKTSNPEEREKFIKENTELKFKTIEIEQEAANLQNAVYEMQLKVPNVIAGDVPEGKDDSRNVVLRRWGEPKVFAFKPKDHYELGTLLDVLDTETSAKVSGSRFVYLKNELVLLQFGLIQFVLNRLTDRDFVKRVAAKTGANEEVLFTPIIPPVIAKSEVVKKMERFDPIDDRYYFEADDSLFIGSAEHTLGPMFMNHTFEGKDLPKRFIGYSTAFRREAGTYGKDTVGIFRRHQFDKLEMESFSTPENGLKEQEFLIGIQEALLQELKIPYEVMIKCPGDMGKPDFREIDINCWMPGQNKYRETHTSDYMTDYQARRLNTRVKMGNGNKVFVHMNDATAFAVGRVFIAIMENYQTEDGAIEVPDVLRKYCGFDVIRPKE